MKKLLFILLMLASAKAFAAPRLALQYVDAIGPATVINQVYTSTATNNIVIASSTVSGSRVCLTNVFATATSTTTPGNFVIYLLDGGTTNYIAMASTGNVVNLSFPPEDPWCNTPGKTAGINGTSLISTVLGMGLNISYKGYSY